MSILYRTHRERYDYLKAEVNYEIDKEILKHTVKLGKDLFAAPMTIGDKFTKASTPRNKHLIGGVALVAPFVVAPFSTVASAATFTFGVPVIAAKTGIDRARMKWNDIEPIRV